MDVPIEEFLSWTIAVVMHWEATSEELQTATKEVLANVSARTFTFAMSFVVRPSVWRLSDVCLSVWRL